MAKLLTKRVKTVNPAGGVNPALEPNAGQYGWTQAEAAHVKQLIGYVDASRKAAEYAVSAANYVEQNIGQVDVNVKLVSDAKDEVLATADKVRADKEVVVESKAHVDTSLGVVLDVRNEMHTLLEEMTTAVNSLQSQITALDARVKALESKP